MPLGEGWDTLGCDASKGYTYTATWGETPLPIADATYDVIYASHVIEHISWMHTSGALREARRILTPGGLLELWTVNHDVIEQAWRDGKMPDKWRCGGKVKDVYDWCNARMFAYKKHGDASYFHHCAFNSISLNQALTEAGFTSIERLSKPRGYDHGVINLGLCGRKPSGQS